MFSACTQHLVERKVQADHSVSLIWTVSDRLTIAVSLAILGQHWRLRKCCTVQYFPKIHSQQCTAPSRDAKPTPQRKGSLDRAIRLRKCPLTSIAKSLVRKIALKIPIVQCSNARDITKCHHQSRSGGNVQKLQTIMETKQSEPKKLVTNFTWSFFFCQNQFASSWMIRATSTYQKDDRSSANRLLYLCGDSSLSSVPEKVMFRTVDKFPKKLLVFIVVPERGISELFFWPPKSCCFWQNLPQKLRQRRPPVRPGGVRSWQSPLPWAWSRKQPRCQSHTQAPGWTQCLLDSKGLKQPQLSSVETNRDFGGILRAAVYEGGDWEARSKEFASNCQRLT